MFGVVEISKRVFWLISALLLLCAGAGFARYAYFAGAKPQKAGVAMPKFAFSVTGTGADALKKPLSAVLVGDRIFVADSGNKRVSIFSSDGTFIRSFKPIPEVQSAYPMAVAADKKERVYLTVTVGSVNKIMVFDKNGDSLYAFPDGLMQGYDTPVALSKPVGLCVAGEKLYVTDIGDHDVKVFGLDGRLIRKFGGWGHGHGMFSYPNAIAVDASGRMYVSDSNNGRVEVFDENGRFVSTLVSKERQLVSLPRGIAVDRSGNIHVVDVFSHKIYAFTPAGVLLFNYGEEGGGADKFYYPNGLAVDSSGRFLIADRENNRISIWQVP